MSTRDEMMRILNRTHQDGMVGRDEAVIDEIYAADFVNESPGLPDALRHGPDAIREEYRFLWSAFSDMKISHDISVVEGEYLGLRWWWEARHTGPFLGFAPTGATISIEGYDLLEIRNGKITRAWVYQDNANMMRQLQAAAAQAPGDGSGASYAFST
jgi:predicted ester cyclase